MMTKTIRAMCLAVVIFGLGAPAAILGQGKKPPEAQPIKTNKAVDGIMPGKRDDVRLYKVTFKNNDADLEFIVKCNIPLVVMLKTASGVAQEIRNDKDAKYAQNFARGKELTVRAKDLLATDYFIEIKPRDPGASGKYTLNVTKPTFAAVAPKGGGGNVVVGGGKTDPLAELNQIRKELQSLLERLDRVEKQIGERKGEKDK